jgi:hypothetical protein
LRANLAYVSTRHIFKVQVLKFAKKKNFFIFEVVTCMQGIRRVLMEFGKFGKFDKGRLARCIHKISVFIPKMTLLKNQQNLSNLTKCHDLILAKLVTFAKALFEKNETCSNPR